MNRLLILGLLLLVSCSSGASNAGPQDLPAPTAAQATDDQQRASLVVPLTLHVVVEAGATDSDLSSRRAVDDLSTMAQGATQIWAQADVVFDPINLHIVELPTNVLQGILVGNTDQFFAQVNNTFFVQDSQAINGFFVRSSLGFNGLTPQGSNLFFVIDEPSVADERVTSHELGHIFGLHHDLNDPGQLMFSGTNGTVMSEIEQQVARYSIVGLFPQDVEP